MLDDNSGPLWKKVSLGVSTNLVVCLCQKKCEEGHLISFFVLNITPVTLESRHYDLYNVTENQTK
jgi:hypothetical protein